MTTIANRLRIARTRAKRLGLTMRQHGGRVTLRSGDQTIFTGCLIEAEAWLKVRQVDNPPGPPPTVSFPAAWEPWIEAFTAELHAARRRPKTIRLRLYHLSKLGCQHPDPMAVTRYDLAAHLGTEDWTPNYAHSVRATLRVFFGFLHTHGHRGDNPSATLLPIRVPRSRPRPCPDHTIRSALASVTDERVRLAIRLGAEAGLRRAEIAGLRTTDVLGTPGHYYLHVTGKGGNERQVPICDELAAVVLSNPTTCLFPRWNNSPMLPDSVGRLVSRALPDQWAAHSLRHRFATTAYQGSLDLRAVQELLGHTSPTTTAIYTAVGDDSLRSAALAAAL